MMFSYKPLFAFILLHTLFAAVNAQDLPPPPFWHFSVLTGDKSAVLIIFSKDWSPDGGKASYPQDRFLVEKSNDEAFMQPKALPSSYTDTGSALLALDQPWSGSNRPYYRVSLLDAKKNIITVSTPLQPVDQAGNTFVVQGSPQASTDKSCGDITTSPCANIRSALLAASPGSTIYVTPGIYNGIGNSNLTFSGKAVTIQSTNGNSLTMINCTDPTTGKKTRGFTFTSNEGRDSVISGLTIADGAADFGGCIYISGATPTIKESFFFKCNATTGGARGGAIYSVSNPDPGPLIQNTNFVFNWGIEGGAIFVGGDSHITIKGSFFEWGICPTATGRGGAVCAYFGNVTMTDSTINNHIVGFGGGAFNVERGTAVLDNVIGNNNTAGNFGGFANLFGATMKVNNSQITRNRGSIFSGGVIITSSIYEATNTVHEYNWGRVGGGAIKLVGGTVRLKNCKVNSNSASYGGGFDIANQKDFSTMYTEVIVEDSEVRDNVVPQTGAGFHLDTFDAVLFRNVTFANNTATKGGAGYCNAPNKAVFDLVTFEKNVAQLGGGLYTDMPCGFSMNRATFRQNSAVEYGAGIATGDGVNANITNSRFEANGMSDCLTRKPPMAGGGIMIGVEQFQVDGQCGASTAPTPTRVFIGNTSFLGNVAITKGGGIDLESGVLTMDGVEFDGNKAIGGDDSSDGLGGGIAIIDRCPTGLPCSIAIAKISNSRLSNNFAKSAGGGVHYYGGSVNSSITIGKSVFSSNSVEYDVEKSNPVDGVGGGLFIGKSNFSLSDLQLIGNQAFYGGGVFFSTSLDPRYAKISKISAVNNKAVLGPAAFWLRSASPNYTLPTSAFIITQNNLNASQDGQQQGPIATEVLNVSYTSQPPTVVRSAEDVSTFSVALLDYYGNIGTAELGSCQVTAPNGTVTAFDSTTTNGNNTNSSTDSSSSSSSAPSMAVITDGTVSTTDSTTTTTILPTTTSIYTTPAPAPLAITRSSPLKSKKHDHTPTKTKTTSSPSLRDITAPAPAPSYYDQLNSTDNSTDTATVRPLGSEVGVGHGVAVFSQLVVSGNIGENYTLHVDCKPNSMGRSRFLELDGSQTLPTLSLPITVSPCRPGREPKQTSSGVVCLECPYNTYNYDGEQCKTCPRGAVCAGGDQVSSQENWWRSSLTSIEFYSCRAPGVCEAGPVAGNDACVDGHIGPLCAVCQSDWFNFANKCLECNRTGQAKAMLSITIILIIVIIVLIFMRSWEFGDPTKPGLMTKVKIFITHFQLLALFRDYDVLWPDATGELYSWFDAFNLGLNMMAPACFFGAMYNFWTRWIFQMALPVGAVLLCVAVYYIANRVLKRKYPDQLRKVLEEKERAAELEAVASFGGKKERGNSSSSNSNSHHHQCDDGEEESTITSTSGISNNHDDDDNAMMMVNTATTNATIDITTTPNASRHTTSNASEHQSVASFPLTTTEAHDDHDNDNNNTTTTTITPDEKKGAKEKKGWAQWLLDLRVRCWKNAFWLVTLLYPRSSMTALQMFGTQTLDTGTYLTADYSIMVAPPNGSYTRTYINYMIPGAMMLVVFAIVIPAFWFFAIWRNRRRLEDRLVALKYGFLYGSYKRTLAYWETFEALRKFIFALIPVFVKPNSVGSMQGTVGQLVAGAFVVATVWLRPYANEEDNNLQIASNIVLWLVLLSGTTAKWLDLNQSKLKGLAAAQLILSSFVAFACIAAIGLALHAMLKSKKKVKKEDDEDGDGDGDGDGGDGGDWKVRMKRKVSVVMDASKKSIMTAVDKVHQFIVPHRKIRPVVDQHDNDVVGSEHQNDGDSCTHAVVENNNDHNNNDHPSRSNNV